MTLPTPPANSQEWLEAYGQLKTRRNEETGLYELAERDWWSRNIVYVELPFALRISWDKTKYVKSVAFNAYAAAALKEAFTRIADERLACYLCEFGGTFSLRKKRGGVGWSTHSWAASIDLNPETNGLGVEPEMNDGVIVCFEQAGFFWGGNFKRQDGMHFQFGREW